MDSRAPGLRHARSGPGAYGHARSGPGAYGHARSGPPRWRRLLLLIVVQILTAAALVEVTVALYFRHPLRVPRLQAVARSIYGTVARDVI